MKPFGTLTRDFSFVEPSTREILEEIIEISPNYPEFTKMLCKKAMSETAADEIVLLALQHASNLSFGELEWKVSNVHSKRIAVLPYLLSKKASDDSDWEIAIRATEDAIDQSTTDWESLIHLLHMYSITTLRRFGSMLEERTQKQIEDMIQNNQALEAYSPRFYLDRTI